MKQLVFIDDSGDPGFIRNVSSARLIMAGAVFTDSEEATKLNNEISKLRKTLGWHENHEFKFSKAPKSIKLHFLKTVSQYNFNIYAVYIDKTNFTSPKSISSKQLYNWTTKELLKIIPLNNANIKIDGRANKNYKLCINSYLRKEINSNKCKIKEIKIQDSIKDNLIQLADMIAGSINRSFQDEKTDAKIYINIIKDKIIKIKPLNLK